MIRSNREPQRLARIGKFSAVVLVVVAAILLIRVGFGTALSRRKAPAETHGQAEPVRLDRVQAAPMPDQPPPDTNPISSVAVAPAISAIPPPAPLRACRRVQLLDVESDSKTTRTGAWLTDDTAGVRFVAVGDRIGNGELIRVSTEHESPQAWLNTPDGLCQVPIRADVTAAINSTIANSSLPAANSAAPAPSEQSRRTIAVSDLPRIRRMNDALQKTRSEPPSAVTARGSP